MQCGRSFVVQYRWKAKYENPRPKKNQDPNPNENQKIRDRRKTKIPILKKTVLRRSKTKEEKIQLVR